MKKNKRLTVTIGIPAYNEEKNIAHLLVRILSQKTKDIALEKVFVVSDGSTDATAEIVSSFKDKRISFINRKSRRGKTSIDNLIVQLATTDILVMLDSDVLPQNNRFLESICKPFLKGKNVGLVGAKIHPLNPLSFFERVIAYSHIVKRHLFRYINNGDTIYLCHGRARAFAKGLYKTIRWPIVCPEDAYSYLYCKKQGFLFVYERSACVLFRAPTNLSDHTKQSKRFQAGAEIIKRYFPKEVPSKYGIPKRLLFTTCLQFFLRAPVTFVCYCLIQAYIGFIAAATTYTEVYDTSKSTKRLEPWRQRF